MNVPNVADWTGLRAWLLIILCVPAGARGQDEEALRARVLAEYPAALARLEAAFTQIHGSGTRVEVDFDGDDVPEEARSVTTSDSFAVDGDRKKLVLTGETGGERIACSNSQYSFRLTRASGAEPRIVTYVGGADDVPEEFTHFATRYLAAPYSAFQWVPISEILADPTFELKSVAEVAEGGRDLLRIEFSFRPDPEYPTIPGWVLVSPDEGWVLHRFEGGFGRNSDIIRAGAIEYEPNPQGGIPIPRRITFTHPTYRYTFDIEHFTFGPTPEREFTLRFFGLPEIGTTARPTGWPMTCWLFGLALLAFATALVLRYYSTRVATR